MASVSVIIVNWNGRGHLEHCLPALKAQTLQADEIIVVDNASHDDSVAFLRACHLEVKVVELKENRGFSGGNIAGYEVASGDYIVLLNNDTRPLEDWLEQLVACADAHPEAGIIASHLTDWEGNYTDTAGDGCSVSGRGFKLHMNQPTWVPIRSGYVFSACAGAALYKREMLDEVGFFDESFFLNAEDTDLAFRAQLRGWKVYLCADSVVRHRISGSQGNYSRQAVFYSSRNHTWLYFKCMPSTLLLKYAGSFWLHLLLSWGFFTLRGRGSAYVAGFFQALRALPLIWRLRQEIQANRQVSWREVEKGLTPLSALFKKKFMSRKPRL